MSFEQLDRDEEFTRAVLAVLKKHGFVPNKAPRRPTIDGNLVEDDPLDP